MSMQTLTSPLPNRCGRPSRSCYTDFMDCEAAIAALKAHESEFRQLGVEHLYLFGSTARGEARDNSDVDLFLIAPKDHSGYTSLWT